MNIRKCKQKGCVLVIMSAMLLQTLMIVDFYFLFSWNKFLHVRCFLTRIQKALGLQPQWLQCIQCDWEVSLVSRNFPIYGVDERENVMIKALNSWNHRSIHTKRCSTLYDETCDEIYFYFNRYLWQAAPCKSVAR